MVVGWSSRWQGIEVRRFECWTRYLLGFVWVLRFHRRT